MAQSKQDELYKALQQKGYPDSLCRLQTDQRNALRNETETASKISGSV